MYNNDVCVYNKPMKRMGHWRSKKNDKQPILIGLIFANDRRHKSVLSLFLAHSILHQIAKQ